MKALVEIDHNGIEPGDIFTGPDGAPVSVIATNKKAEDDEKQLARVLATLMMYDEQKRFDNWRVEEVAEFARLAALEVRILTEMSEVYREV